MERAFAAADGLDVSVNGGPATIRQYLRAGLIDELHVAIAPLLLGAGEHLFGDLGDAVDGYECVEATSSPAAAHMRLVRTTR